MFSETSILPALYFCPFFRLNFRPYFRPLFLVKKISGLYLFLYLFRPLFLVIKKFLPSTYFTADLVDAILPAHFRSRSAPDLNEAQSLWSAGHD